MQVFNYDSVHTLVESQKNAYWDGWTLIIHRPNPAAIYKPNGSRRNGVWGLTTRIDPDQKGLWRVPKRLLK